MLELNFTPACLTKAAIWSTRAQDSCCSQATAATGQMDPQHRQTFTYIHEHARFTQQRLRSSDSQLVTAGLEFRGDMTDINFISAAIVQIKTNSSGRNGLKVKVF